MSALLPTYITEVTVRPADHDDYPVIAYVSVTLNYDIALHDIRLVQGENHVFMSMPSRRRHARCRTCNEKTYITQSRTLCRGCHSLLPMQDFKDKNGKLKPFVDVCHPTNQLFRNYLEIVTVTVWEFLTSPVC